MRTRQQGFTLIEIMVVIAIIGVLAVAFANFTLNQQRRAHARGPVAVQIASVVNAVRSRVSMPNATADFAAPLQTFVGTSWLKDNATCPGGAAPTPLLICTFMDVIPNTGGLTFTTDIANNANVLSAVVTIADAGGGGYESGGALAPSLAGLASTSAQGVFLSSLTPAGLVTYMSATLDQTTAVITITVDVNAAAEPFLRVDGQNTQNADITYSGPGYDLVNANDVFSSRVIDRDDNTFLLDPDGVSRTREMQVTDRFLSPYLVDADDNAFYIDPNGGTNLNAVNANSVTSTNAGFTNLGAVEANIGKVTADQVDTKTLTSDLIGTGIVIDNDDNNFWVDPSADSRVNDMFLASRGNVRLSELLPNYSLKDSTLVANTDIINKPNCGTIGTPQLMLIPRAGLISLRETTTDHGSNHTKTAAEGGLFEYTAVDNGGSWTFSAYTYNEDGSTRVDMTSQALAHVYCYYP